MVLRPGRRLRAALFAATAVLILAACDTAEERAEKHFESAVELLANGDAPRARVELQNVFKLNEKHRDGRALLGSIHRDAGEYRQAYGQYLRLVEQYPDDVEGLYALSDMAIKLDNWQAAEPHIVRLTELRPDEAKSQVLQAALDYANTVGRDEDLRREAAERATALKELLPEDTVNRAVIIDSLFLDGEYAKALTELDELQAIDSEDLRFHRMRLRILVGMDDRQGIEDALLEIVRRFPEDEEMAATLIAFYDTEADIDGAEQFLRSRYAEGEKDNEARVALIQFLTQKRSLNDAIEQTDRFIEEGTDTQLYRSLRATLLFDNGDQDGAIAELEDILSTAEPSDATNEVKISLAQILSRTGNEVGARALVEDVLATDESHVNALRVKALWLITEDETDEAIILLRRALDQEPRNSALLTTMAEAHLRNGERELAGEMLANAVNASNRGLQQSLDYARFLSGEDRYSAAESVILDALRIHRSSLALYEELIRVFLATQDWPRLTQVENTLRSFGAPEADRLAERVRVSMLRGQRRDADAIAYLESLSERDGGNRGADLTIVRAHLENNDQKAALNYLAELRETYPDDVSLRFMTAAVTASIGRLEEAERLYRGLIVDGDANQRVHIELVRVLNAQGELEAAETATDEALEIYPGAPDLLWMQASFAEQKRDFEGAIAIYEQLYADNSTTSVIANNLASLLSTTRTDEESLNRAWRIARRLRDSPFPAYQDTYGWIAYLRGDYDQALSHLEPAAEGLPQDAMAQAHLGLTYVALEDWDKAKQTLERALEMAGDDPRPTFEKARSGLNTALATLQALSNRDNGAPAASD